VQLGTTIITLNVVLPWCFESENIISFKTEFNLNYIYILTMYRTVNTLRLGYKNQSINIV